MNSALDVIEHKYKPVSIDFEASILKQIVNFGHEMGDFNYTSSKHSRL